MVYEFNRNKVTIEDCDRIIQQYYFGSISEINDAIYTAVQKDNAEEATEWLVKWFEYSQLKCDGSCGKYEGFETQTCKYITGKPEQILRSLDLEAIFPDFIYDKSNSRAYVKTEGATDLKWTGKNVAGYKRYNAQVVPYERGAKSKSITTSTAIHDQNELAKIGSLHFNELPVLYDDNSPNALKLKKNTTSNESLQYLITKDTAQTISAEMTFEKIKITGTTNVFKNNDEDKERIKSFIRQCIKKYCEQSVSKYDKFSTPIGFEYVDDDSPSSLFDGVWEQVGIFNYPETTNEEELATRPKIWRRIR